MTLKRPTAIVFLLGVSLIVLYYVPHPVSGGIQKEVATWVRIVANCALLLGVVSLLQTHWRKVSRREEGYGYSVVLFASFAAMTFFGLAYGVDAPREAGQAGSPGYWLFQNVKAPLESTIYSLLAFFIASAAYRAFRARSWDATLMLAAAIVVMLGRIPLGAVVPNPVPNAEQPLLFAASQWLLDVPTTAAKRALYLGIALSAIATSLRIIAGLERGYMGRD